MAKSKYSVQEELRKWLSDARKVVVAGIGNPIRMDDSLGVKIVQELHGKVSERALLIECETVPESFIQEIMDFQPSHVLLIDAAILGLKSGEARLLSPDRLTELPAYSTHMLPLRLFCRTIEETTNARIALLLVEPKVTEFGEGLTAEIRAASKKIVSILLKFL